MTQSSCAPSFQYPFAVFVTAVRVGAQAVAAARLAALEKKKRGSVFILSLFKVNDPLALNLYVTAIARGAPPSSKRAFTGFFLEDGCRYKSSLGQGISRAASTPPFDKLPFLGTGPSYRSMGTSIDSAIGKVRHGITLR
ncbi:hypothetical protein VNO78_34123 [Psophocarpus tetragonolobus]|uniref:Uncharacterized protein n=1 Tax=Psophocarpus tetragonolobus TaxID=3891 RepID=A0AAN9NY06_PSOTE